MGCNESHTFGDGHVGKCDVQGPHELHHTMGPTSMHGQKMWTTPPAPKRRVGDLPSAQLPKQAGFFEFIQGHNDDTIQPCKHTHPESGAGCQFWHSKNELKDPNTKHFNMNPEGKTQMWKTPQAAPAPAPKTAKFVTRITRL